jgi:hypothetical protein
LNGGFLEGRLWIRVLDSGLWIVNFEIKKAQSDIFWMCLTEDGIFWDSVWSKIRYFGIAYGVI